MGTRYFLCIQSKNDNIATNLGEGLINTDFEASRFCFLHKVNRKVLHEVAPSFKMKLSCFNYFTFWAASVQSMKMKTDR